MSKKLTLQQAIIVSGYTGFMACPFSNFHEDVEKRLGRPVFTHEFGNKEMSLRISDLYKDDFIAMCADENTEPA